MVDTEEMMIDLHPEFISKDGKPAFAVIPYAELVQVQALLEDLEDLQDLRAAKVEAMNQSAVALTAVKEILGLDP